ncbi:MAG: hypothetical protein AAFW87_09335 [Pseudomonadota bacterium]
MFQARVLALSFLTMVFGADMGWAGAWLRADGETFLSFSVETEFENGITDGSRLYGTVYAEHGLTQNLTLGLDAGGYEEDFGKVIGFLRWPLGVTEGPTKLALEFGMGLANDTFAIRPGISWGRGISAGDTPGWLSVETRATIFDGFDGVFETDFTIGLKPAPKSIILFQLQTGTPSQSDPYAKLAPSYVHEIKPGRHIELGLTAGILEDDDFKLKFGFWRRF